MGALTYRPRQHQSLISVLSQHHAAIGSTMKFRKCLIAVMCAASLGAVPLAASAAVDIYFNAPPPAARYEAVPAARHGYIWSPGYWNLHNNRHDWQAGHWEKERKGYT